ncbi:ABC transporter permease [Paenibacillus sp. GXUN7292]|uniref:ABC transporter permease n=1 Tax=Paenibacillus sp. GXUN7292 TaxID=3422499 RepID=UPI003D7D818F
MMLKQFNAMFISQIKMTFREKQVWFWSIFFPVILMVIFMTIFGGSFSSSSSFKANIAIVDAVPNSSSAMLIEQLKQIPVFEYKEDASISIEQGREWVEDKKIDALIVMPENEGKASIQLIVNREKEAGATTQAIAGILQQFTQYANLAVAGIEPTYTISQESITTASDDIKYTDFLLTGMIGLSVAQAGLFGMVDMVDMRKRGLLTRLRMTPARMGLFGLSSMVVRMLMGVLQIIILSIIGVYVFGATLHFNLLTLTVAFLIGTLVFNAMGYLFSSFSKTMEAYMGVANITSMLMMFLSGVFFPLESLPSWLQFVPKILPLTYFVDGMREGLIYAGSIMSSTFWMGVGIMSLWGVVSFLIASQLYKSKSLAATR